GAPGPGTDRPRCPAAHGPRGGPARGDRAAGPPDLTARPPYGRPRSAAPGTRERVPRGYPVPPEEAERTGGVTGSGAPVGWDGHVTHYERPHGRLGRDPVHRQRHDPRALRRAHPAHRPELPAPRPVRPPRIRAGEQAADGTGRRPRRPAPPRRGRPVAPPRRPLGPAHEPAPRPHGAGAHHPARRPAP